MSQKKLLIITQDFPPYSGRGAVMRILKFAKYLPEFGWQPFIVAEKKDETGDATLLEQLPPQVRIKYVYSLTPQKKKNEYKRKLRGAAKLPLVWKLKYLLYRSVGYNVYALYQNYLMAPDLGLYWAKDAARTAVDLHRQHSFDAFLTSAPPFSTFKIGIHLKERLELPWVLDFRDGWVGNPIYLGWKKTLINLQNRRLEAAAMAAADLSVFATEPMQQIYEKRYPRRRQKMVTITNGFDSADYAGIQAKAKNDHILHFVYSGTISGRQAPTTFLKGLLKAISEQPEIRQHLRVSFVGKFNYRDPDILNRVKDLLIIHGSLPHREALEKTGEADVFLLLINPSGGKTMMTGKIFEYLAFRKPIFAVSIPCAATDLIRELGAGYIADFRDEEEIKTHVLHIYDNWKNGKLAAQNRFANLDQFERKNLTIRLSDHLDRIIARGG